MSESEWIVVGEEGAPPYGEGWSGSMKFRKVSDPKGDFVEVKGVAVPDSPIFTLPEEARPGFMLTAVVSHAEDGLVAMKATAHVVPPAEPDSYVESWTFGQGSFGHRCRVCLADDYAGPLVHKPGCPGAKE
jgi:hypothetical protein